MQEITIFKNVLSFPEYAVVNTKVISRVKALSKELGLEQGRYAIRVIENSREPWLDLDFSLPGGEGDNCVPAKLLTLDNHPDIRYTGQLKGDQLGEGEVEWFGGISVPFVEEVTDEETGKITIHKGVVQSVYSGAEEHTDCFEAFYGFRAYKEAIAEVAKNISFSYDFSEFEKVECLRVPMVFIGLE